MMNPSQYEPDLKKPKNLNGTDQIKILLVDDRKDNLLALDALIRRDDLEIFKANSGTQALEFMFSHEIAVALIDVQMPCMSGFELAELMRGTNKTKDIPIIFVTAIATANSQSFWFKGYEVGAVDFLLKPLDPDAVKSKVNIFIEFYRQKRNSKINLKLITRTLETLSEGRNKDGIGATVTHGNNFGEVKEESPSNGASMLFPNW